MAEQGIHKLQKLQRRYINYHLLADALFAASIAVMVGSFMYAIFSWSGWWSVVFFIASLVVIISIRRSWQIDIKTITSFLNLKYPDLEESCELALKEPGELNLLEKLQLGRVEDVLEAVPAMQWEFTKWLRLSALVFLIAPVFAYEITQLHDYYHIKSRLNKITNLALKELSPEKILPQIESVNISIAPPAYTNKPARQQDKFTLEAEDGSDVTWKLKLNVAVKQVSLIFNNRERIMLKNTDNAIYSGQKNISQSGFYQVDIDGKLSDLYQLQVIKDNPPVIHIKAPSQYTYIDAGEPQRVAITAAVDDDYGITNAFIYATVAKGSGEAVKFKEQRIDFGASFGGHNPHYDLQKLISLPSLHMEPGDELYFYIQAQDNHNQQSRTDVYIVAIQDTAQLLSMDGLLSGVNVKPEYFRSERQIILDSQKLLKDRDSISTETFNNRSNELGTDQKLLRLRYGKFLGEESESDIVDPKEDKNDPVGDVKNYGNAAVILDKYTDKHDNAEDAQFFDPTVKAQLKATLTEMWKAELQLRLYKPDAALPFEYKALRLLKDLQQKSRLYVAKTAYNPSPLKMEKRLTGDLGKIIQPVNHQDIQTDNSQYETLKNAVSVLEELRNSDVINNADRHTLQSANQQLSEKASAQPEVYLPALNAFRRILSTEKIRANDIGTVEKAIQRLLPANKPLPNTMQNAADMGLAKEYYQNLNHK